MAIPTIELKTTISISMGLVSTGFVWPGTVGIMAVN